MSFPICENRCDRIARRFAALGVVALGLGIAISWAADPLAPPTSKPSPDTAASQKTASPPADERPAAKPVQTQVVPFLGTATTQATPEQHAGTGLPTGVGLYVQHVLEDSPAEQAGLQLGDVLHKLDDQILVNDPQFRVLLRMKRPGDRVQFTLVRQKQPKTIVVQLGRKEVPVGDVPARELLDWMLRPGPGEDTLMAAAAFTANYEDGEHTLFLSKQKQKEHLLAKDKQGKVLFDGPINTEADRQTVPEAIRPKLKLLETMPKPKAAEAGGAK
jgi:hypothetical protein